MKCKCGEPVESATKPVCKGCVEYSDEDAIHCYTYTVFDCPLCGKTTEIEEDAHGNIEQCEHCKSYFKLSNI